MPLRAERAVLEWLLHLLAIALVVWAWWRSGHPATGRGADVVEQADLRGALVRWTMRQPERGVHVRVSAVPDVTTRDWLGALQRTGSSVTWDGALPATAVDVEAIADPKGLVRVGVAAPVGGRVAVGDGLGLIDSAVASHGAVAWRMPPPVGRVTASVGGTIATAGVGDSVVLKRIYVVGRAGWEAKFIVRALEEEGWGVDAHLFVAPKNDVVPAKPVQLDTGHYAAVIAIDSSVAQDKERVARYVASGGGLMLAPSAAGVVGGVAVGPVGVTVRGAAALVDSAPRAGLTVAPITRVTAGAVALEHRDAMTTVAARRVGNGRVVQIGYSDTWRWRMAAGDSGAAAYRAWWAGLVAAVAYAPVVERASEREADPAPFVAAVERLGAPLRAAPAASAGRVWLSPVWVFAIVALALVAEWASRRLRGAR